MTFKELTSPEVRAWFHNKSMEIREGVEQSMEDIMSEFWEWFKANKDIINKSPIDESVLNAIRTQIEDDDDEDEVAKPSKSKKTSVTENVMKCEMSDCSGETKIPDVYVADLLKFVGDVKAGKYDSEDGKEKYGIWDSDVIENLSIMMKVGAEDGEPFDNFKSDILRLMRIW